MKKSKTSNPKMKNATMMMRSSLLTEEALEIKPSYSNRMWAWPGGTLHVKLACPAILGVGLVSTISTALLF